MTMPRGAPATLSDKAYVDIVAYMLKANEFPAWMLAHSTDPIRTGNPQPAAGEREAAEGLPLGPGTFRLLVSAAYAPQPLKGHKVEVRGFLIRRPTESRLNITSLETLDPSCVE